MPNLILDLEIDAACYEYLTRRIAALGGSGLPQLIVHYLDNFCDICEADPCVCEISEADYEYGDPNVSVQIQGMRREQLESEHGPESSPPKGPAPGDEDPDWDELTAKVRAYAGESPSLIESTEAMLGKMGV